MTRRAAIAAIALAAWLAPVAATADIQASASVTLTDLGVVGKRGSHNARISWTANCDTGQIAPQSYVALMHVPKRPGARLLKGEAFEIQQATGTEEFPVLAGRRVKARIVLICERDTGTLDADGEPVVEHKRVEADTSEEIVTKPFVLGWRVTRGTICNAPPRAQETGMGKSDFQTFALTIAFGRDSMLRSPSVGGMLKEIRLRVSGKGVRVRKAPDSGALRKYGDLQTTIYSPASGKVKLWAEIGGVATANRISVPLVGKPCQRDPKRYYGIPRSKVNTFIKD